MKTKCRKLAAFSIIEALIAFAVLAILGAVAMETVGNTTKVATTTKLEQDVAALNSAVNVFKANGGRVADGWEVSKVLAELKTKADGVTAFQLAGLRGSVIDHRLRAIDESPDEASSGEPKALWDSANHRFYLSTDAVRGIKRFDYDESLAEAPTEGRARTIDLALNDGDGWVWDYSDSPSNTRSAPNSPDGSLDPNWAAGNGSGDPLPNGPLQLNPPLGEGGIFDLIAFPRPFRLVNENPEGVSITRVSLDGMTWSEYRGTIDAQPGATYYSYADAVNDTEWLDSEVVENVFQFHKVPLQVGLAFDKASYHYGDMGGAFIGGGTPGSGANRGLIRLVNADMVPATMMNSNHFVVRWTYDGSSPLGGNAATGAAFNGVWADQPVGISHGNWGEFGSTVTVSAAAQSLDPTYLIDSPVQTATLAIQRIQLREPVAVVYESRIGLSLVTSYNDMPVGARLVFNVNGVDPGDANGEPTSGVLYNGGQIHLNEHQVLVARVYGPSGYNNWFLPSAPVAILGSSLELPDDEDETDDPSLVTDNGLVCGHLDVDTSSFLAEIGYGTTDGHIASYDDRFETSTVDFLNLSGGALHNLSRDVADGDTRFKLIVSNPDLSTAGRVAINATYVNGVPSSYVGVRSYASIELEALPVFSLNGVAGTTRLTDLRIFFPREAVPDGGIIPTTPEAVRANLPGRGGEWRNGALTIQAVRVNADGSPAFTTDRALSAGGVQGVARSGLLWEANLYLSTDGASYDQNLTWSPGSPSAVCDGCCGGDEGGDEDAWLISGFSNGTFSNPTGDLKMNTNLTNGQSGSYFAWGTRYNSSYKQNSAEFDGSLFDGVGVGERFLLGTFVYHNGTTNLGTNATAVDFSIDIAFMGGAVTKTFDYSFGLYSTPNNTGSVWGDADFFRLNDIQSSGSVNFYGSDFRLDLAFGQTSSNGFSTIDEFHIFENTTGYGELWGTIVPF